MSKVSTWILVGSKSSYNTSDDTLVCLQGPSFSLPSPCLVSTNYVFCLDFPLLHKVSKQGIVFIELCIVDMAII